MSTTATDFPGSVYDLFLNRETCYEYEDRSSPMDNNEAMSFFLDEIGATDDEIVDYGGTQVLLSHPDFAFSVCIESYGLGDFFSHGFAVTIHH